MTNGVNGTVKPVDSATKLSELGVKDVYSRGQHTGRPADLIEGPPGNLAGYSEIPLSMGFDYHSSQPNFARMTQFSINPTIIDGYVYIRTADTLRAFPLGDAAKYGIPLVLEDLEFKGWNEATRGSKAVEYVKPNPEVGLFEFPEHIPDYSKYGMTDTRVPVKDLEGLVPINIVGNYVSMIENAKQALRNIIYKNYFVEGVGFNPVTEAWIEKLLEKEGFGPAREIAAYGVENFKEEGIAARTYYNGKAVLAASRNINEWASRVAEAYGLSGPEGIKFVKESIWRHELFHVLDRRKGGSIDETEAELGDLLAEFYKEMAETRGERYARYYRALAKFNSEYAEDYRSGRVTQEGHLSKPSSNLEDLIDQYASEAERLGLEGEEAKDYVSSRLEKEAEAIKSSKCEKGNDAKDGKNNDAKTNEGDGYERNELKSEESEPQENAESDGDAEANGGSSDFRN